MFDNQNNIVTVKIIGGLGNQMFQYACGRAAAIRSNAKLLLDTSAFDRYKLHQYGLDDFCIQAETAPFRLRTGNAAHAALRRVGVSSRQLLELQGIDYISENQDLSLNAEILMSHRKVYIDGYWQSEDYFVDAASVIRNEFALRDNDNSNASGTDEGLPSVSLHIRRGDYVSNAHATAVHGVLGLDYYHAAIAALEQKIGDGFRVAVFSDDIAWAEHHLTLKQETTFISGSTTTPHNDLHRMASCDHHIIANSTFSWWGAWLNPSPNKIVVAPQRWFVTEQYSHLHICPHDWLRV